MKISPTKIYISIAAACLAGVLAIGYWYFFTEFTSQKETHYLYIDSDDTTDSVVAKLRPMATPHALTGLGTLARHSDYNIRPLTGRYAIEPGRSTVGVFRMLKNGLQKPLMLTIPEARTMDRLAARLAKKLMLDSTTIAQALTSEEVCQKLGFDTTTIAAMIVPDTYEVFWDTSIDALLSRLQKEHDNFWGYDRRHKAEALGLSPTEVATLASIIDEETANNGEKPMIAGMYLNRLKKGMPLQADPTVKFAMKNFGLRRIYKAMLTVDSPYNTYQNAGLPPGPIKIASIKGIDAVLNAVGHDYLYMCANDDFSGTHKFAATYKEHQENARRYAKALNARGIK